MKKYNPELVPERYRGVDGLINWGKDSLKANDVDCHTWMMKGLFDRYEHNIEQRLWVAYLASVTYWAPTAWVIWNEFPDMDLVDPTRLEEWNAENWKKLRYQTDLRWNKGHLATMYASYHKWIDGRLQHEAVKDDYNYMWEVVLKDWHKVGRFAAFLYLQCLNEFCGYEMDAPTLVFNDYSGSKSHRNGLILALRKDDWISSKLTSGEYEWLENSAEDIRKEVGCSNFQFETILCSYKKLARGSNSRYIGYYTNRQEEEINKTSSDGWSGIDWSPWWKIREAKGITKTETSQLNLFQ